MTNKKAPTKGAGMEFASILQGGDAKILKNSVNTKFSDSESTMTEIFNDCGGVEPVKTKGLPITSEAIPGLPQSAIEQMEKKGITLSFGNQPEEPATMLVDEDMVSLMASIHGQTTPKMLFGQLWYEGDMTIMFADTNQGKSMLAVQIADAITQGRPTLGQHIDVPPQKVLYVDLELDKKSFAGRYTNNGNDYQFSPLLRRAEFNADAPDSPDGMNEEEFLLYSLEAKIYHSGAKIVIIDNLTFLSRENEKQRDALPLMKHFKRLKKRYGLSILLLGHTPKRNAGYPITINDLAGSKMLANFCDGCFAIGESCQAKNIRYIKELKQRHDEFRYHSENVIVCEVCKPDNFLGFRFLRYDKEKEHLPQQQQPTPTKTQVFQLLKAWYETPDFKINHAQLAKALGVSRQLISRAMN